MNGYEKRQKRLNDITAKVIKANNKIKRVVLVWVLRGLEAEMRFFMKSHSLADFQ